MSTIGSRNRLIAGFAAVFAAILCAYPFVWMFLSSFKTNKEIYQPLLFFPSEYESDAFVSLFSGNLPDGVSLPFSFVDVFLHSILASGSQALFATILTAMAGYAFAKYRFRWKNILFLLAMLVILVPRQALAVPLFEWLTQLNLNGSLWAIILPGAASGIGVIFFTQIFRRVPDSLMGLAQVEGAS
ncbi:MAG: carbohydrate ABC transporter permease, partial [Opitutales bacterium]